jgi:hypothetical protein
VALLSGLVMAFCERTTATDEFSQPVTHYSDRVMSNMMVIGNFVLARIVTFVFLQLIRIPPLRRVMTG